MIIIWQSFGEQGSLMHHALCCGFRVCRISVQLKAALSMLFHLNGLYYVFFLPIVAVYMVDKLYIENKNFKTKTPFNLNSTLLRLSVFTICF